LNTAGTCARTADERVCHVTGGEIASVRTGRCSTTSCVYHQHSHQQCIQNTACKLFSDSLAEYHC